MFQGVSTWADLFKRQALLNKEQGARMNLYPLIVAAIICDAGGALEITEKALREAVQLRDHPFDMVPGPTGVQLTFRMNLPSAEPVPFEPTDRALETPSLRPSVWQALDEWKARVDRFISDRRKLGGEEDGRAEAAEMVLQWLWETISGGDCEG